MIIKQKIRTTMVALFVAVSVGTATNAVLSPTASADPGSTQVTCKDGNEKTANKSDKPDNAILDEKDFEFACRNNDGYAAPADSGYENPIAGTDCGGVKTAIIKCSQNNTSDDVKDNGVWGLLLIALNFMTAGVGILAVGGIVYGAILYTTAEDKADQVKKAVSIITNVVVGLIMFALMWSLLNFLIPGGIFS